MQPHIDSIFYFEMYANEKYPSKRKMIKLVTITYRLIYYYKCICKRRGQCMKYLIHKLCLIVAYLNYLSTRLI